jgi:hypothetical protein
LPSVGNLPLGGVSANAANGERKMQAARKAKLHALSHIAIPLWTSANSALGSAKVMKLHLLAAFDWQGWRHASPLQTFWRQSVLVEYIPADC